MLGLHADNEEESTKQCDAQVRLDPLPFSQIDCYRHNQQGCYGDSDFNIDTYCDRSSY